MDIETIRKRVTAGDYLVGSHAVQHAVKEGFERKHMVEAVLDGSIIETYPGEQRVLICGPTTLAQKVAVYLHVVCEHADPIYVDFVTAYIPDEGQWQSPPYKRRKRKRK
ncbi:MAG: DUF4258 domain-containing protein [bacterium]|nr:DUF4258 domain-containing protein [bacterium]